MSRLVAVTGGIASGKSSFAQFLKELGAFLIDADEIVTMLYQEPSVKKSLREIFGPEVILASGSVNRRFLARSVFFSHENREKLNQMIHPLVKERVQNFLKQGKKGRYQVIALVVPLLPQSGLQAEIDWVVWVKSPRRLQLRRLEEQGFSFGEALARLEASTPAWLLRELADYVVVNQGSLADLEREAKSFWQSLMNW
jgi:dephospho-CoA kinase